MMRISRKTLRIVVSISVLLSPLISGFSWGGDLSEPLSLEQAVDEGLKNNLDLLVTQFNIPLARADELTAGLWNNPSMSVMTSLVPFGKRWDQSNAGGPIQTDLMVFYPVDANGKISASKKVAAEATRAAEASFQDQVRLKVLEIRMAYLDLLVLQSQLRYLQNKGKKETTSSKQAKNQDRQQGLEILQKQEASEIARISLASLIGRFPTHMSFETSTSLEKPVVDRIPDTQTLFEIAQKVRPDVQNLKLSESVAGLNGNLAKAKVWNDINLGVGLSRQETILANQNVPGSFDLPMQYSWAAYVLIPLPLFNRNQGNISRSELMKAQAEKQLQALFLSIRQELEVRLLQLKGELRLINELKKYGKRNTLQYYEVIGEYRKTLVKLNAASGQDVFVP